jgi:hypothetical protein
MHLLKYELVIFPQFLHGLLDVFHFKLQMLLSFGPLLNGLADIIPCPRRFFIRRSHAISIFRRIVSILICSRNGVHLYLNLLSFSFFYGFDFFLSVTAFPLLLQVSLLLYSLIFTSCLIFLSMWSMLLEFTKSFSTITFYIAD